MGASRSKTRHGIFSGIFSELAVARITWLTNLRAAMELRAAFVLQIFGMMLNNMSFIILWLLFFHAVGSVNGWDGYDAVAMIGFGMLSFGCTFGFAAGSGWLPRYVEQGTFDEFLLSPRNLYVRVATSRFDVFAIGDALLGTIIVLLYCAHEGSFALLPWLLVLLPPAMMVTLSMSMTAALAAFFFPDANAMSQSLVKMFLTPSIYPSVVFPSGAKFFFTFIIPSLVIGGLPIEAVKTLDWRTGITIWAVGIGWLLISVLAFYRAVRRYESGNYLGMRS